MYSFESRVRYSETGKDGRLTLESILNYFQDASTFHSKDVGYDKDYLQQQNTVWVLLSWQIVVVRYPKMGEYIKIATKPYDFRKSFGYRNFMMYDEKGDCIAYANSVWLYMDTIKMLPAKVEEKQIEAYGLEEKLPMEYAEMKIARPKEQGEKKPAFQVQNYHLDTNEHVNNGQYLRMACQAVGLEPKVKQMRAEYKKSALLGDVIQPEVHKTQSGYIVTLNDTGQKPYAVIEFTV